MHTEKQSGFVLLVSVLSAACFLLFSCGFISFDSLHLRIWPSDTDSVLPEGLSPYLDFPGAADKPSAEKLVSMNDPTSSVNMDFRWVGNRVYIDAVGGYKPGRRYSLTAQGHVLLADGTAFDDTVQSSFYSKTRDTGPMVTASTPSDDTPISTSSPLVLNFSRPMDSALFGKYFQIQPAEDCEFTWSAHQTIVSVKPASGWRNLQTYTWRVLKGCLASDKLTTSFETSGAFRVGADAIAPAILSLSPTVGPDFPDLGISLALLKATDSIRLVCSEDISLDSLVAAFSLEPKNDGVWVRRSPGVFAFTPQSPWLMATSYRVRVSTTLKDLSGNSLAQVWTTQFTPDIPILAVSSVKAVYISSTDEWTSFNDNAAHEITVGADTRLSLIVRFNQEIGVGQRQAFVSALSLSAWFPSSLADPAITSVLWADNQTLSITWEGLSPSTATSTNYYQFRIPGGTEGPDAGNGARLKEDVWLYFAASL